MRYYTIEINAEEYVAASVDGESLYVLPEYADMNELIEAGGISEIPADAPRVACEYKVLAPIPRPKQDVICLGINYADHAIESARFHKEAFGGERPYPIFFSKRVNYAPGPEMDVPAYVGLVDSVDYECELGVIIGRDAKDVAYDDASDYIFGYTIVNDVSARNLQTRHKQWYFGKSLDGFTPMGPCILSADEVAFPPALGISSYINGELRQNSNTANLMADIPKIIECLTEGMTLQTGSIIATGTPSGVGMGMQPPQFLKPGDVMEMRIEKIGSLKNYIK